MKHEQTLLSSLLAMPYTVSPCIRAVARMYLLFGNTYSTYISGAYTMFIPYISLYISPL